MDNRPSRATACLVVIPAFNEGADIGRVIREIRSVGPYPVVVVDDASTDDTVAAARAAGAVVLPLSTQLGAWGAIQTGLRYALLHGYPYCVTMDGDGQHDARHIDLLLGPVQAGETDVSIGACTERGSLLRKIAWVLMKRVSGLALEDITSGFRAYNEHALRVLSSWQANLLEYQDVGVLVLLQAAGIRVTDVGVTMQQRKTGKSRIFNSWFIVIYYMCHTLLLGFSKRGIRPKSERAPDA